MRLREAILGNRNQRTYSESAQCMRLAIAWVDSLGLRASVSRLRSYARILDNLGRMGFRAGADLPNVLPALHEVFEFLEIWEAFRSEPPSELLTSKLRLMIGGAPNLRDELAVASKNVARNTSFELVCAAHAKLQGLRPTLRADVDFQFMYNGKPVLVECKRIFTEGMAPRRIEEGFAQLSAARQDGDATMLLVDLRKMVNPQFNIPAFNTPREASQHGQMVLYHTFWRLRPTWNQTRYKEHIGLCARVSTLTLIRQGWDLDSTHEWAGVAFSSDWNEGKEPNPNLVLDALMNPRHMESQDHIRSKLET